MSFNKKSCFPKMCIVLLVLGFCFILDGLGRGVTWIGLKLRRASHKLLPVQTDAEETIISTVDEEVKSAAQEAPKEVD